MPQIWLTYDELGAHFGCPAAAAREGVVEAGWDRKRSRDGLTRVKLPPATAVEYLRAAAARYAVPPALDTVDAQVAALRGALARAGWRAEAERDARAA